MLLIRLLPFLVSLGVSTVETNWDQDTRDVETNIFKLSRLSRLSRLSWLLRLIFLPSWSRYLKSRFSNWDLAWSRLIKIVETNQDFLILVEICQEILTLSRLFEPRHVKNLENWNILIEKCTKSTYFLIDIEKKCWDLL
jgi:hypothetical protein